MASAWDITKAVVTGGVAGKTGIDVLDGLGAASGFSGILGGKEDTEAQTQLARDATAGSTANAQALYEEALRQAASANAIQAPGAIVSPAVTAQQLNAGSYNVSTDTTAQAEDASARMRAYQAAIATAGDATSAIQRGGTVDVKATPGAYVGGVDTRVAAPMVGEAAQTGATTVGSTELDPLANQLRGDQIAAAKGIASAPSAAMNQFKAGQSQVVSDQLATAERARGAERAGARRDAMIAIGSQGAQQNLAAAALSAQEEQAKRVAASAALSGVRTADVATSTTQASIDAQRASLQAQIDAATAQGNTAAVNALQTKQAELTLSARQAEVQGSLTQQGQIAELSKANMEAEQQRNVLNATAKNQAERDYQSALAAAAGQTAANQTTVSLANAQGATAASKDYATAVNAAAADVAARQTQANIANATLTQQQAQANAERAAKVDTGNQTAALAAGTTSANNALAAQGTNASNQLATNQLQQQGATSAINAGTGAVGIQSKDAQTIVDANKSGSEAQAKKEAGIIGAAGGVIGAVASDERVKKDIKRVPDAALADLADHVNAYAFRYKDGYEDSGATEHVSQMAQELERSALGKKFVHKRPDGVRTVDTLGLAAAMAAASAASIRKQEGRRNV